MLQWCPHPVLNTANSWMSQISAHPDRVPCCSLCREVILFCPVCNSNIATVRTKHTYVSNRMTHTTTWLATVVNVKVNISSPFRSFCCNIFSCCHHEGCTGIDYLILISHLKSSSIQCLWFEMHLKPFFTQQGLNGEQCMTPHGCWGQTKWWLHWAFAPEHS